MVIETYLVYLIKRKQLKTRKKNNQLMMLLSTTVYARRMTEVNITQNLEVKPMIHF